MVARLTCPVLLMAKEAASVPLRLQVTLWPSGSVAVNGSPMSVPPAVFSSTSAGKELLAATSGGSSTALTVISTAMVSSMAVSAAPERSRLSLTVTPTS